MITKDMWFGRFEDNELTARYFEICSLTYEGKGEKHHILPRSMWPEYEFCDWNLVNLSVEDHYKVHEILPQVCLQDFDRQNMLFAWNMLNGKVKGLYGSESVERLRQMRIESLRGEGNPMFGTKGALSPNYGKKLDDETKLRNADASRKYSFERYTKDGVLVKTYDRISDVIADGFDKSLVFRATNGSTKSHRGFLWKRIPKLVRPQPKLESVEEKAKRHKLNISEGQTKYSYLQYDLSGKFLKMFLRSRDLVSEGYNNGSVDKCCTGLAKTHRGFQWRRVTKQNSIAVYPNIVPAKKQNKAYVSLMKKVCCIELDMVFCSLKEAARWLQPTNSKFVHGSVIGAAASGKNQSQAYGYHWKFLDTPPQPEV